MNISIVLHYQDGSSQLHALPFSKISADTYRFAANETSVVTFFLFDHTQQHSRLDVSLLEDTLIISFDKHHKKVGATYCHRTGTGPFVLHNKQRLFLIGKREEIEAYDNVIAISFLT